MSKDNRLTNKVNNDKVDSAENLKETASIESSGNPSEDNPKKNKEWKTPDKDDFSEINKKFGSIDELDNFADADDTLILINGIDSRLKDHPKVKSFPYEVRWNRTSDSVNDSDEVRNRNYIVINKNWSVGSRKISDIIKTKRDDSPNENSYRLGTENILCMCPMDKYNLRQRKKRMKHLMAVVTDSETRRQNLSKMGGDDAEASRNHIAAVAQQDRAVEIQLFSQQKGISIAEAERRLNAIDNAPINADGDVEAQLRELEERVQLNDY